MLAGQALTVPAVTMAAGTVVRLDQTAKAEAAVEHQPLAIFQALLPLPVAAAAAVERVAFCSMPVEMVEPAVAKPEAMAQIAPTAVAASAAHQAPVVLQVLAAEDF